MSQNQSDNQSQRGRAGLRGQQGQTSAPSGGGQIQDQYQGRQQGQTFGAPSGGGQTVGAPSSARRQVPSLGLAELLREYQQGRRANNRQDNRQDRNRSGNRSSAERHRQGFGLLQTSAPGVAASGLGGQVQDQYQGLQQGQTFTAPSGGGQIQDQYQGRQQGQAFGAPSGGGQTVGAPSSARRQVPSLGLAELLREQQQGRRANNRRDNRQNRSRPDNRSSAERHRQGRQTSQAVARRNAHPPAADPPRIHNAADGLTREEVYSEAGLESVTMVNRSRGGGAQDRVFGENPDVPNAIDFKSSRAIEDVPAMMRAVEKKFGPGSWAGTLHYTNPHRINKRLPQHGPSPDVVRRAVEELSSQVGPDLECPNCQKPGHGHFDCLLPDGETGTVHGCPLCGNHTHNIDECALFKRDTLESQVQVLVQNRARMPAFETKESWKVYLQRYLDENPRASMPSEFPWTADFSTSLSEREISDLQKRFSVTRQRTVLPIDPATKDLEAVIATMPGFSQSVVDKPAPVETRPPELPEAKDDDLLDFSDASI